MREIQPHEVLDGARLSPKRNPAKVSGQGGGYPPGKSGAATHACSRIGMLADKATLQTALRARQRTARPQAVEKGPMARAKSRNQRCGLEKKYLHP
jgi:hypothetical protein